MAPGPRTEQLLRLIRKKIAAVSHMSPFLAKEFRHLDQLSHEVLGSFGSEAPTTGDRLGLILQSDSDSDSDSASLNESAMQRVALLEASLTRAMEHERLELGMSAPELCRLIERANLDFGSQVRLLYFFTLAGETSWQVLASARVSENLPPTLDPVCRALRSLKSGDQHRLRPMHRLAVKQAPHRPMGFCRLLVEESLTLLRASDTPNFAPLTYLDELLNDPFLAVAAPLALADVRARAKLYLAQHHALEPSSTEPLSWLQAGADLLPHGTGDPELKAVFFEAQGAVAIRAGGIEEALRAFMRANVLLSEIHMADRRAESLLQYSLALSAHSRQDRRAALVLESTLAMLVGMTSDLAPTLRLRLLHFLALVELRRARDHIPHPLDGFAKGYQPTPSDVRRRVTDWSAKIKNAPLSRASTYLTAAEDLYFEHAPPLLRLHRSWLLGQAFLVEHPDLALIHLLTAHEGFEVSGCTSLANQARRDVTACLAYLGRRDQCMHWLENQHGVPPADLPPEDELIEDLSMLCHGTLGGASESRDADILMAKSLGLIDDGPGPHSPGLPKLASAS